MAEIKLLWIVKNVIKVDGSLDWLFEDPAVVDDDHRLAHYCGALDEGGYDIDKFVRIYWGGKGHLTWDKEKSKLYADEASARADAQKRFKRDKTAYERRKKQPDAAKTAAARVAARYARKSA